MRKYFSKVKKHDIGKTISILLSAFLIFQFILPIQVLATTNTWGFSTSSDYTFDNTKIEFSSGQAQLKVATTPTWYNSSWSYRKKITIDHTKVQGDETDFPILINFSSDADMTSHIQADGDDILFTSSNGTTKLSHEIEKYTNSTGELVAWVKIPSLSSSVDTDIYLYYGNASTASNQDVANVWNSNFIDVWHQGNSQAETFTALKTELAPVTLTQARGGLGMAAIGTKVYMGGGASARVDVYDTVAETVTQLADTPGIVGKPCAGAVNGKFYIIGGANVVGHAGNTQVWEYNPDTNSWTTKASTMPTAAGYMASLTYNNKIYCVGGVDTDYHPNAKIQIYDPSSDTWTIGADMPSGYANGDGIVGVLNVGGKDYIYHLLGISSTEAPAVADKRLIRYDIELNQWETGFAQYPEAIGAGSPAVLNNKLIMFGGWNWTTQHTSNRIYEYDPILDLWSFQGTTSYDVESVLTSAKVSDNLVIVANGYADSGYLDEITKVSISSKSNSTSLNTENTINRNNPGVKKASGEPIEAAGKIGNAQNFDGQDDFIDAYIAEPNTYSLSFWVKPDTLPAVASLMSGLDNTSMDAQLWSNGTVGFQTASGNFFTSTKTVSPGSWYNFTFVYDGTNAKIYWNGDIEGSQVKSLSTGNSHFFLGKRSDGYFFDGQIDEVQISKTVLSANWIKTSYNNQNSPSTFYSVGSQVVPYDVTAPSVAPVNYLTFTSLSGLSETATKNGGEIKYQVSNDNGTTWYWYNSDWTTTSAGYTEANTASVINTNIATLPSGSRQFVFKAYLNSDGTQLVQLDSIDLTYQDIITHTINASAGVNGSVSPSGATTVSEGSNQTITITPNAYYHITDVLVDGISIGTVSSFDFTNVTTDHTISATFAEIPSGGSGILSNGTAIVITTPVTQTPTLTTQVLPVSVSIPETPTQVQKPAVKTYNLGTKTLKQGSRGVAVKELQRFLNAHDHTSLIVDGIFGKQTMLAVKNCQKEHFNLLVDGVVGPKTREKMLSVEIS